MPQYEVDTHDSTVQASAARLIRLLRACYPDVKPLTKDASANEQGSLIQYLGALLGSVQQMEGSDIDALRSNASISGTLAFIDELNKIAELSAEDKKRVYKQLMVIAQLHPEGHWDANHEQWSKNRYYNSQTQQMEEVLSPPAETLNLVCRALLDKQRYLSEEGCEEEDLKGRLMAAFSQLVALRVQTEGGSLEKCSAGLQHDLLYWLNEAFLDKPKGTKDARAVRLLMGAPEFYKESVSLFLGQQIQSGYQESEAATDAMLEARNGFSEDDQTKDPLILWLRTRFMGESESGLNPDNGWKQACSAFIETRCYEFGIKPNHSVYSSYIDAIHLLNVPFLEDKRLLKIQAIQGLPEVGIMQHQYTSNSIKHLMVLRNCALNYFKGHQLEELKKLPEETIDALFSLIHAADDLFSCRDMVLVMDNAHEALAQAGIELRLFLINYLEDYAFDKPLAEDFWRLKANFNQKRQAFFSDETLSVTFIVNYFAVQNGTSSDWDKSWQQLQALAAQNKQGQETFIFTDVQLEGWQQQAQTFSEDGRVSIDLTPYAINRLVLHGLLVPYPQWTSLYSHYLKIVCEWLLTADSQQELLRQFIRSYPGKLLSNLYVLSCVHSMLYHQQRVYINQICLKGNVQAYDFVNENFMYTLFRLSAFSAKAELLNVLQGRLGEMIRNGWELKKLMELYEEQLNAGQKTQILTAIESRLGDIIKNGSQLQALMELPKNQLNSEQKIQLWTAVEGKLGKMIRNSWELQNLMILPESQLNAARKTQLLTAVEGKLGKMIKGGGELKDLMTLPESQLNAVQKAQLLTAVKGRLGGIVKNASQLQELMALPENQLNAEQKTQLLTALESKLGEIIKNGMQLFALMALPENKLNVVQKKQLWTAVKDGLGEMINHGVELQVLMALPESQLNSEQKTQLWTAVEGRLCEIIKNEWELHSLMDLPESYLNAGQKSLLWKHASNEVKAKIPDSIAANWLKNRVSYQKSQAVSLFKPSDSATQSQVSSFKEAEQGLSNSS